MSNRYIARALSIALLMTGSVGLATFTIAAPTTAPAERQGDGIFDFGRDPAPTNKPANEPPAALPAPGIAPAPRIIAAQGAAARLPQPDPAARTAAKGRLREVFGPQIDAATTPADKRELARRMLRAAVDGRPEPADRFMLLSAARNAAADAGDAELAMSTVEELARTFDVDLLTMSAQTLEAVAKASSAPATQRFVATRGMALVEPAVAADNLGLARVLAALAWNGATQAGEGDLAEDASRELQWVESLEKLAAARAAGGDPAPVLPPPPAPKADGVAAAPNVNRPVVLDVTATIDGSDVLLLTPRGATWKHKHWEPPTEVTVNGVTWDTQLAPQVPGEGAFAFLKTIDLASAKVLSRTGRDTVAMEKIEDGVAIYFNDSPNGGSHYEIHLEFRRK